MCKLYEFPVKREFPKELEDRLAKMLMDFVGIMDEAVDIMYDGRPEGGDLQEFTDIMIMKYLELLSRAIDQQQ